LFRKFSVLHERVAFLAKEAARPSIGMTVIHREPPERSSASGARLRRAAQGTPIALCPEQLGVLLAIDTVGASHSPGVNFLAVSLVVSALAIAVFRHSFSPYRQRAARPSRA
jgi:hypothetical protein